MFFSPFAREKDKKKLNHHSCQTLSCQNILDAVQYKHKHILPLIFLRVVPYFLAVDIFLQNEHREILLIQRGSDKRVLPGYYNGIGGKIEGLETVPEALLRECREEIGTDKIKNVELKTVLSVRDKHGLWLIFCYAGRIKKSLVPIRTFEEGRLEWVLKKDLGKKRLVPDLKVWYRKLFQKGITYVKTEYDKNYHMKNITLT